MRGLVFGFAAFHGAVAASAAALGHFGVLRPVPFLAVSCFLSAILLFFLRRELWNAEDASSGTSPSEGAVSRWMRLSALLLLTVFLAAGVSRAWALPPGANNYDDTHYHLSAVAVWFQSGDLRMLKFPVGDGSPAFYPVASEIFSFFLLSLTAPSDVLARASELPFALLSLGAVYALGRKLRLSAAASLGASVLSALTPGAFPGKMMSAGNDHATAFYFAAGLLAALHFGEQPDQKRGIFLGLTCGLLLGTKYSGVTFVPLVAAVLLARILESRPLRIRGRDLGLSLATAGAVAALAGGYTYLRNWVTAGNPLFPATIKIGGVTLLPGWRAIDRATLEQSADFAIEPVKFLFARPDLWGGHFVFLLLPAAVVAPFLAVAIGGARRWSEALLFLSPVYLFLVFLRLMPDHREIRYIFSAPLLASLALAYAIERFRPGQMHIRGPALLGISGVLLAFRLVSLLRTPREAPAGRYVSSPAAEFVEKVTAGKPARVALLGTNQPYLFFGQRLQNSVSYVPFHAASGAEYYSWRSPLDFPHRALDRRQAVGAEAFWRNLLARQVQGVVIARTGSEYPAAAWVSLDRQRFERLFAESRQEVYLVKQPPADSPFVRLEETIPGSLDEPEPGAVVRGDLTIRGWCLERGGGPVELLEARLDGEPLDLASLVRVPRDDVRAAFPEMGDARSAGFELTVPRSRLSQGTHELRVSFGTRDLRVRLYPPVTFQFERSGRS